jgi:hypothetical protein
MGKKPLSFETLMGYLVTAIHRMVDPRGISPNRRYSLKDIVLAAFSVFFMQCESFLEHQREMEIGRGENNAQTLFGLARLPSDPQIRNVLDKIPAHHLDGVFHEVYQSLEGLGLLQGYQYLGNQLLVALDGTQYFSSDAIHCDQCSHREDSKGRVSYFHSVILPVIVSPDQAEVISLAPEYISPQDGHEKQDCETAAAKRWIVGHQGDFGSQGVTVLGDDLLSRQPMCEVVLQAGMNFIFTCLPKSHETLYEWIEVMERMKGVHHFEITRQHLRKQEIYQYRYANEVPIRDEEPALYVNWCELTVIRILDGKQKQVYHNAWVTNHELDQKKTVEIAAGGRSRWKTENENHNVLKTKGYSLEHNFGHGHHHLSKILLTLNVLAFLFHTVLQLVDDSYQQARKLCGTRKVFFRDLRSLTKYFCFESWLALIGFMISGQLPPQPSDSS